jgi:serine/threonine-protein kinase RsbW
VKLMVDQDDIMIYNGFIKNDAHLACEKVRMIVAGIEDATGINSDQSFDVRVIISELVQNAIRHGSAADKHQKVYMSVRLKDNDMLSITVQDPGNGFDALKVIKEEQSLHMCGKADLTEGGRGLFIVKSLCDDMIFNTKGNCITVCKKLV